MNEGSCTTGASAPSGPSAPCWWRLRVSSRARRQRHAIMNQPDSPYTTNRPKSTMGGSLDTNTNTPTSTRITQKGRSEEHTSELQSLMRISYAVFCLKKKKNKLHNVSINNQH